MAYAMYALYACLPKPYVMKPEVLPGLVNLLACLTYVSRVPSMASVTDRGAARAGEQPDVLVRARLFLKRV